MNARAELAAREEISKLENHMAGYWSEMLGGMLSEYESSSLVTAGIKSGLDIAGNAVCLYISIAHSPLL